QDPAVLELVLGHAADGGAVDVDVAAGHRAGDPGDAVDQVDHHAVLGEHDPLGVETALHGERAIGHEVTDLTVHGQDVLRSDDVVAVEQFAGRGVPGDVHAGVRLVHDLRPEAGEAV